MITVESVRKAKSEFEDFIKITPLELNQRLSNEYNANIYLKREDTQVVRSYKIRWAFNLINSLSKQEKDAWVVCASAWNHAQWVALTCNKLKIKWTIFMPLTTPEQKVYKTKKFGGEYITVVLQWDTFDEALAWAREFEKMQKATFVHPFDDERIIVWQATVWLEILQNFNWNIDFVICPIGWGGLVSWIISVFENLSKNTKVIWVEPAWAVCMKNSLESNEIKTLEKIDTFVDGAAVKTPWTNNFKIAKNYNLKVFSCPENRVCSTMIDYLKEEWIVLEPAWALSTDVLKDNEVKEMIKWKNVVLITSWWNFDFERLPDIKERSLKFEWLKRYFLVTFPQRPGALKEFLSYLWTSDDITRFEYLKKSNKEKAPALVWIQTNNKENFNILTEKLKQAKIHFEDITENEMYFDLLI